MKFPSGSGRRRRASCPGDEPDLLHWFDEERLDPYLNVSLLEPHPAFAGVRPSWVYGTCWIVGGRGEPADFQVAPQAMQEDYRNAEPLPYANQPEFPKISF